ncbi:MAG: hypothetical protein GY859_31435, partial [Desulfobacterales bacterium]|nr:hypothetical protein [Desulfobacterales bacterium]
ITVSGVNREYEVFAGEEGSFSHGFSPLPNESGVYTVRAMHPDLLDRPVHGLFVINRLIVSPQAINLNIPRNYTKTIHIDASAADGTALNNLRLVYVAENQPGGVLPEGVHLTPGAPVANLTSGKSAKLPFTLWADNFAENGSLILKVVSDETDPDAWESVTINTHFSEAMPVLHFTPSFVETGVARNDTVTERIILKNKGLADMRDVHVSLVDAAGAAAPNWIYMNNPGSQGALSVGEEKEINISFSPGASVVEGIHTFYLRVESANYPTRDIGLSLSVTQSGVGNVLFNKD